MKQRSVQTRILAWLMTVALVLSMTSWPTLRVSAAEEEDVLVEETTEADTTEELTEEADEVADTTEDLTEETDEVADTTEETTEEATTEATTEEATTEETSSQKKAVLFADDDEIEPEEYLTFYADEAFSLVIKTNASTVKVNLYYSTDGKNWTNFNTTSSSSSSGVSQTVAAEKNSKGKYVVYLCGSGNTRLSIGSDVYTNLSFTGSATDVYCEGNVMSLLDYSGETVAMSASYTFAYLFKGCTKLASAPELPAETLYSCCYYYMFYGCTNLKEVPELPATTLVNNCYASMFYGCTSLQISSTSDDTYIHEWTLKNATLASGVSVATTDMFTNSSLSSFSTSSTYYIPCKYNTGEDVAATCTEAAYTLYTCKYDSDHTKIEYDETLSALGHTVVIDAASDVSCGEKGLTEGSHCSVCGEVLVAQEEIIVEHTMENDDLCKKCGYCNEAPYNKTTGYYEISTRGQLLWFAALVNGDATHADFDAQNTSANAMLMCNIDLNPGYTFNQDGSYTTTDTAGDLVEWTIIGSYALSAYYYGTFDGQGHTVSGIYVAIDTNCAGFFGRTKGATICNLNVEGYISGAANVGGIVGFVTEATSDSTVTNIDNCSANVIVKGTYYAGGLVGGINGCSLTNSSITGGYVYASNAAAGGLVGTTLNSTYDSITNCCNLGATVEVNTSTSQTYSCAGGILGSATHGYSSVANITNCYNLGTVIGKKGDGGIVGGIKGNSKITYCYNLGTVTSSGSEGDALIGYKDSDTPTLEGLYYLSGKTTSFTATAVTEAQFASGEICYLLSLGVTDGTQSWYQTLNSDGHPVLDSTHGTVYYGYEKYTDTEMTYSNDIRYAENAIPVIALANGEDLQSVYCNTSSLEFTITEANLATITDNGTEVEATDNQDGTYTYILTADNKSHTIVVTDKTQGTASVTTRVYSSHPCIVVADEATSTITETCPYCDHENSISISAPTENLIYDGTAHLATVDAEDGYVKSYTVTYTCNGVSTTSTANAGEYVATLSSGGESVSVSYTVKKASLTVTADDATITYGETPEFTYTAAGFVNVDSVADLSGEAEYTCDYTAGSDVGEYDITISGLTSDNYDITFVKGSLTVTQATNEIEITTESLDKPYDGEAVSEPAIEATFGEDTVKFTWYEANGSDWDSLDAAPSAAGSYKVVATIPSTNNYSEASDELAFTIADSTGVGTVTIEGWTYGDEANAPVAASETNGTENVTYLYKVQGADDSTYTDVVPSDAGNYTVQATFAASGNYKETTATADFTIAAATLTITADDVTVHCGEAAPEYTATYTGFVNGDTASCLSGSLTFVCAYTTSSDAGTYDITLLSTLNSSNYTITCVGGTLKVEAHTEVTDAAVAATCTETGLTEGSHCSQCDAVIVAQDVISTTGHTIAYDETSYKAATCETAGYESYICSVCNETLYERTIAATGHTYYLDKEVTYHQYVCATCNSVYLTQYHQWSTVSSVAATIFGGGSITYECDICGYQKTEYTDPIEFDGETFSAGETALCIIETSGSTAMYKVKVETSGYYILYSSTYEEDVDTFGELYDSTGSLIKTNDDGGVNYHFSIKYYLEAGETYYLNAYQYSYRAATFYVSLIEAPDSADFIAALNFDEIVVESVTDENGLKATNTATLPVTDTDLWSDYTENSYIDIYFYVTENGSNTYIYIRLTYDEATNSFVGANSLYVADAIEDTEVTYKLYYVELGLYNNDGIGAIYYDRTVQIDDLVISKKGATALTLDKMSSLEFDSLTESIYVCFTFTPEEDGTYYAWFMLSDIFAYAEIYSLDPDEGTLSYKNALYSNYDYAWKSLELTAGTTYVFYVKMNTFWCQRTFYIGVTQNENYLDKYICYYDYDGSFTDQCATIGDSFTVSLPDIYSYVDDELVDLEQYNATYRWIKYYNGYDETGSWVVKSMEVLSTEATLTIDSITEDHLYTDDRYVWYECQVYIDGIMVAAPYFYLYDKDTSYHLTSNEVYPVANEGDVINLKPEFCDYSGTPVDVYTEGFTYEWTVYDNGSWTRLTDTDPILTVTVGDYWTYCCDVYYNDVYLDRVYFYICNSDYITVDSYLNKVDFVFGAVGSNLKLTAQLTIMSGVYTYNSYYPSGSDYTFQWYVVGSDGTESIIEGATSRNYMLSVTESTFTDVDQYICYVYDADGGSLLGKYIVFVQEGVLVVDDDVSYDISYIEVEGCGHICLDGNSAVIVGRTASNGTKYISVYPDTNGNGQVDSGENALAIFNGDTSLAVTDDFGVNIISYGLFDYFDNDGSYDESMVVTVKDVTLLSVVGPSAADVNVSQGEKAFVLNLINSSVEELDVACDATVSGDIDINLTNSTVIEFVGPSTIGEGDELNITGNLNVNITDGSYVTYFSGIYACEDEDEDYPSALNFTGDINITVTDSQVFSFYGVGDYFMGTHTIKGNVNISFEDSVIGNSSETNYYPFYAVYEATVDGDVSVSIKDTLITNNDYYSKSVYGVYYATVTGDVNWDTDNITSNDGNIYESIVYASEVGDLNASTSNCSCTTIEIEVNCLKYNSTANNVNSEIKDCTGEISLYGIYNGSTVKGDACFKLSDMSAVLGFYALNNAKLDGNMTVDIYNVTAYAPLQIVYAYSSYGVAGDISINIDKLNCRSDFTGIYASNCSNAFGNVELNISNSTFNGDFQGIYAYGTTTKDVTFTMDNCIMKANQVYGVEYLIDATKLSIDVKNVTAESASFYTVYTAGNSFDMDISLENVTAQSIYGAEWYSTSTTPTDEGYTANISLVNCTATNALYGAYCFYYNGSMNVTVDNCTGKDAKIFSTMYIGGDVNVVVSNMNDPANEKLEGITSDPQYGYTYIGAYSTIYGAFNVTVDNINTKYLYLLFNATLGGSDANISIANSTFMYGSEYAYNTGIYLLSYTNTATTTNVSFAFDNCTFDGTTGGEYSDNGYYYIYNDSNEYEIVDITITNCDGDFKVVPIGTEDENSKQVKLTWDNDIYYVGEYHVISEDVTTTGDVHFGFETEIGETTYKCWGDAIIESGVVVSASNIYIHDGTQLLLEGTLKAENIYGITDDPDEGAEAEIFINGGTIDGKETLDEGFTLYKLYPITVVYNEDVDIDIVFESGDEWYCYLEADLRGTTTSYGLGGTTYKFGISYFDHESVAVKVTMNSEELQVDDDEYYEFTMPEEETVIAVTFAKTGAEECETHYYETTTVAATCTTAGKITYTCSECGETYAELISALGHNRVTIEETAATCGAEGITAGEVCSVCDKVFNGRETIEATGNHTYDEGVVTTAATCTEDGLMTYTCTDCGANKTEVITAPGHTVVTDEAVAPTCTETGLTEGSHCSVCNQEILAQEVVPALGHEEVADDAVDPTCTETGLTAGSHCSVCGEAIVEQEEVSALGHSLIIYDAVDPTCTLTGLTEGSYCTVCNQVIATQEVVPATGHTMVYDEESYTAPTCEETGSESYICKDCGITLYTRTIAATGHKYYLNKTATTHQYVCAICGDVELTQYHSFDDGVTDGSTITYTCDVCGYEKVEEVEEDDADDGSGSGSDASSGSTDGTTTGGTTTGGTTSGSTSDTTTSGSSSSGSSGSSSSSSSTSGSSTSSSSATTPAVGESVTVGKWIYEVTGTNTLTLVGTTYKKTDKSFTSFTLKATITRGGVTYKITAIADNAFSGYKYLKKVSLGANVKTIGKKAFYKCTSLTTVSGCKSVTTIKANAFAKCTKLKSVAGCTKVTTIGDSAFNGCTKLTKIGKMSNVITLASVKTIGAKAFYGCTAIKKVNLSGKKLKSIGASAFYKCTAMTTFTCNSTVLKTIKSKAFYGCKNLKTVTLKTTKLTKSGVGAKAFSGIKKNCTFKVPKAKISAYKKIFTARGAKSTITVKK